MMPNPIPVMLYKLHLPMRNVPAALYKALQLRTNGVNITKLESYQMKVVSATQFYADIEAIDDEAVRLALDELNYFCSGLIFWVSIRRLNFAKQCDIALASSPQML